MIFETVCVGPMQVNCYILAPRIGSSAIIIDPGDEEYKIRKVLDKYKLKPAFIINTHGHYDHIGCDDKFDTPVYIHKDDVPLLEDARLNFSTLLALPYKVDSKIMTMNDTDIIELEEIKLKVIHVPGHTPGSIALLMINPNTNIVFTGDSLFYQGIGRTDFPGGDVSLLIKSIKERLLTLPPKTIMYPGHGPSSKIAEEKKNNPLLT